MKQSDRKDQGRQNERSSSNSNQEGHRKTKLKPLGKQKYKPKQVYQLQDDEEDLDLFGYLKEDDDEDDDELDDHG